MLPTVNQQFAVEVVTLKFTAEIIVALPKSIYINFKSELKEDVRDCDVFGLSSTTFRSVAEVTVEVMGQLTPSAV